MPYVPPPSWSTFARLKTNKRFQRGMARASELKLLINVGEAAKLELDRLVAEEIEPELLAGGVKPNITIDYEGAKVRIADEGSGTRIDEALLIKAGVSKKVIEAAKVEGKRKHYLKLELPFD